MIHLPSEPQPLDQMPLAEQHFRLLCLAIEKAHALHMGTSGRLVLNFELREGSGVAHLPRIRPLGQQSFIVDERFLKASELYLYYDPDRSQDLPLLTRYDAGCNRFIAASRDLIQNQDNLHQRLAVPIARLPALRGLHYVKDCVCLQLFEIDFDALFEANAELATQLRQALWDKFNRFYDFDAIADRSTAYEEAAQRFLDNNK